MDTGVKRGLGVTLVGLLAWGLAMVALQSIAPLQRPPAVELGLGLLAVVGLVAIFVGLGLVAWRLLRH